MEKKRYKHLYRGLQKYLQKYLDFYDNILCVLCFYYLDGFMIHFENIKLVKNAELKNFINSSDHFKI